MNPILIFGYIAVILIIFYRLHRFRIWAWFLRKKQFKCTRCGNCCKLFVRVSGDDINKIKQLGHKEEDFVVTMNNIRVLKHKDAYCTFFKFDDKGIGKCSIYTHRPEICSTYPNVKTYFGKDGWDYRCNSFKMPKWL